MFVRHSSRLLAGLILIAVLSLLALSCRQSDPPAVATGGAADGEAPRRIVSLAPNITEILFALGLGDRVVGVTDYCNYPPAALALPKVGGFINPNAEAILALAPDLVIATPNVGNRPFVERIMSARARVLVVQARTVEEIFPAIQEIAGASAVAGEGTRLIASLRAEIAREQARVASLPRTRVLFCIQTEPLIGAGPGSYPGDLVTMAGGENIIPASAGAYPTLSMEMVVAAGPETIVQSLMDTAAGGTAGDASLAAFWGRFSAIPAVKARRVRTIPGDIVLRPGPRVAEGLGALIAILHPESSGAR